MVQVIELHQYGDSYPFGLEKQTQLTYVQMAKQIHSSQQLKTYEHNLTLFKSIHSDFLIQMDSFLQQQNRLLIYYHYQPLSIKTFITHKLNQYTDQIIRNNFLNQVITNINLSIDNLISLLTINHIQAILAIDNIAIEIHKNNQIMFFIEPDFQHLPLSKVYQIQEYYKTEKKKLQIQLELFLQHIFTATNLKPNQNKKANFIIQGNKLVFINNNQQSNRQSSTSHFPFSQIIKNKQKSTTLNSQNNNSQNSFKQKNQKSIKQNQKSKHMFDIKNILDEKKLQKNQLLTNILQNNQNNIKESKATLNDRKQVRNYFQNNDDFNKDASFYPQEFIKDDSIAQFEGYEDQLEKQLQDLKRKKYEEEQQSNKNHNFLVPNSPTAIQLSQQKMIKFPGFSQVTSQSKQQGHQMISLKYPSNNQRDLNSSSNQQNDTSTQQRQKRKYKVTITTSHQVDVQGDEHVNLKQIQKELIEDIKKGRLKGNQASNNYHMKDNFDRDQLLHYNSASHIIKGRQTHNPSSSHQIYTNQSNFQQRNTSLNSIGSNMSSSVDQKLNDERPFSKYHHLTTQQGHHFQSGKEIRLDPSVVVCHSHHHGYDIKKILQKIKTNQQNQQIQPKNQETQQTGSLNFGAFSSKQIQKDKNQNTGVSYVKNKLSSSQYDTQLFLPSKDMQPGQTKHQYDKEYHEKILKAKMKAQQIMKLVKERKTH